jgi:hypothetical protein
VVSLPNTKYVVQLYLLPDSKKNSNTTSLYELPEYCSTDTSGTVLTVLSQISTMTVLLVVPCTVVHLREVCKSLPLVRAIAMYSKITCTPYEVRMLMS